MPNNKYCNLDGSIKIRLDWEKINNGFDTVDIDIQALQELINILNTFKDNVDTSDIEDKSAWTGTYLTDVLNNIKSEIDLLTSNDVLNASGVSGAKITDALNALKQTINAITTGGDNPAMVLQALANTENGITYEDLQERLNNEYKLHTSQGINLADPKYSYTAGVTDLSATLQSIKTAVGATKVKVKVPNVANVYLTNFNSSETDMSNIRLQIPDGGTIESNGTATFNFGGMKIKADAEQHIFSGDLTKFTGHISYSSEMPVNWWGVKQSDQFTADLTTATENTAILQKLVAYLEANYFTSSLVFPLGITQAVPQIKFTKGINLKGISQPADVFIDQTLNTKRNGTIIWDVSAVDTYDDLFVWGGAPLYPRIFGAHIQNLKIEGLYQKHSAVAQHYTGFNSKYENFTIRRFMGSGLYLSKVYDSTWYGVALAECGGKFVDGSGNTKVMYALHMTSYDTDKTNAHHAYGLHIEHSHYGIMIDKVRQFEFVGGKYERGNAVKWVKGENYPNISIGADTQEIKFIGWTITGAKCSEYADNYLNNSTDIPYLVDIAYVADKSRCTRIFSDCTFIFQGGTEGGRALRAYDSNTRINNSDFIKANANVNGIHLEGLSNSFLGGSVALVKDNQSSVGGMYLKDGTIRDVYFSCGTQVAGSTRNVCLSAYGVATIGKLKMREQDFTHQLNFESTVEIERNGLLTLYDGNINSILTDADLSGAVIDLQKLKYPYKNLSITNLISDVVFKGFANGELLGNISVYNKDAKGKLIFSDDTNFKLARQSEDLLLVNSAGDSGDFENGITWFSTLAGTPTTTNIDKYTGSNALLCSGSSSQAIQKLLEINHGDKLYFCCYGKCTSRVFGNWGIRIRVDNNIISENVSTETSEWTFLSLDYEFNSGDELRIDVGTFNEAVINAMFDDVIIINKTRCYGLNKEPTKSEMNTLIQNKISTTGYFSEIRVTDLLLTQKSLIEFMNCNGVWKEKYRSLY
jgi:hypothetical protein